MSNFSKEALTDGKPHILAEKRKMTGKELKFFVNLIPDDLVVEAVGFDHTGCEAVNCNTVRLTVQMGRFRIEGVDE